MKEYLVVFQQYYLNGKTKGVSISDTQQAKSISEAKEKYTEKLRQRRIRGDIMEYKILKIIPQEKQ